MKTWRCRAAAAFWSGTLVCLAGAASPDAQQQDTRAAFQAQVQAVKQPSPAPPAQAKSREDYWERVGIRGFSVALVIGDLAGAATPDSLPAGAKKALSDMRDFLPYKSYRLLDTHWILCCSGGYAAAVSGRLRGAEEDEYAFSIDARPSGESSELAVRFNLREARGADQLAAGVHMANREKQLTELKRQLVDLDRRLGQGSEAEQAIVRMQLEELRLKQAGMERDAQTRVTTARAGNVLDSTFSMKVGETVVIGTSRLKGDKALIALLTAASRNATPPSER